MGCGGRVTRRGTITRGKANRVESAVLGNHFDLTITILKNFLKKLSGHWVLCDSIFTVHLERF